MSDDRYQDQSSFLSLYENLRSKITKEERVKSEGEESKGEITRVDGIGRIENK